MKKLFPLGIIIVVLVVLLISCKKEYSLENGFGSGNPQIVGINCRISQVAYYDSATGVPLGSIAASISTKDSVTDITKFDSLAFTILFYTPISYSVDTIHFNGNKFEYFLFDPSTNLITSLHGLTDPTDTTSPQFDAAYTYTNGYLTDKSYTFTGSPAFPFYDVAYTYTGGNLTHMTGTDVFTGDLVVNADLDFFSNITPQKYLYLFPDEVAYAPYNQFFNFGKRSTNAVKDLKVRYFDPGNVVRDSTVSSFNTYIMSRDNYVLSVYMNGNNQSSIPVDAGKLVFTYHCKP